MANAKKKSPAKKKTSPRAPVKKKPAPAKKAAKKPAPVKVAAKKVLKKKPLPKAKAKATLKPAKKAVVKPLPKGKSAAPKAAAKAPVRNARSPQAAVVAKALVTVPKKAQPNKAQPNKATPKKAAAKIIDTKKIETKKVVGAVKKVSATPARQIARATSAVAKAPSHDTPAPAVRPRMINLDEVKLPAGYIPKVGEEYMSPQQLLYFRTKLQSWREELITESQETLDHLRSEIRDVGDEAERASRESDNILELRTRDRYRKLLKKIDDALKRIEDGSYGFCEETGEEIGLGRLEARPIATLTVDAQERRELFQKQFRDDR